MVSIRPVCSAGMSPKARPVAMAMRNVKASTERSTETPSMRGVFDAEHRFELAARPGGGTHFVQSEHFSGVLVPLLRRSLRTHTRAGFEAMNRAMQTRVEG